MGIASTGQSGVITSELSEATQHETTEGRIDAGTADVSDASPLPNEVQEMMFRGWNATYAEYPATETLASLFDQQARLTPDATALIFERKACSYRELAKRANQIAHRLLQLESISPGDRIAVSVERSTDMVAVLLGILKAGAAYVSIDPAFPKSRIEYMLSDSAPKVFITDTAPLIEHDAPVLRLDEFDFQHAEIPDENIVSPATPDDPAYVIYTSGSTGQPKGVLGLHRGAVNRFHWMWSKYPFVTGDVCCQKTTLSFVDSVWEIFGPLLRGVPSVIFSAASVGNPLDLVRLLATHNVSRMVLVPSLLRILFQTMRNPSEDWPDLRLCVTSGEAVPLKLVHEFRENFPKARLLNLYGSSEVSADVTCFDCADLESNAKSVPLGKPISNSVIHILDKNSQRVAVGEMGEICVGGAGLASGYLNRPDLTEKAFITDPFSEDSNARLYRMGDVGRWLPDGNIEFLGRVDHQIKIRGVRIEPGDIEKVLTDHEGVSRSYIRHLRTADSERLIAYVQGDSKDTRLTAELMAELRVHLPSTMLPNFVIVLDRFPETVNGKLDIQNLPTEIIVDEAGDSAPATDAERRLAGLWKNLLGKEPSSVTTGFFDLGGDSLGIMSLAAAIDREFGRRVPLRVLMEKPTVREAAEWLEDEANQGTDDWSSLVAIRPVSEEANKTPLFLVHGIGGGILWGYNNLAANLDKARPVYAFSSRGLDGYEEFDNPVDMAAQYICDMKTVQPEGPYLVGGYCFGGNIAYEMCRQLRENGDEISLALIIDAYPFLEKDGGQKLRLRSPMQVLRFAMNFFHKGIYLLKMPARERSEHLGRIKRWISWRLRGAQKNHDHMGEAATLTNLENYDERQAKLWAAHVAIHDGHVDTPLTDTPLAILRTRSQPVFSDYARDFGWSKLIGRQNTSVHQLGGHHDFVFLEPNIAGNGKLIGGLLDQSDRK